MGQTESSEPDRSKVAVRPKVIPPNYRDGFDRLAEKDGEVHCKEFYQMQSKHGLGDKKDVVKIPIWISHSNKDRLTQSDIPLKPVHRDWLPHLANAIRDINNAAPGLNLSETTDWEKAKVIIYGIDPENPRADTRGNIDPKAKQRARIRLSDEWPNRKRSSCHELLHALFLQHEQKRSDGEIYLNYNPNAADPYQIKPTKDIIGITRFDPFSIMLYREGDDFKRKSGDKVWNLKNPRELNVEMSELDKVGLNIIFCPCQGSHYSPKMHSNGLWYCGRQGATEKHNRPAAKVTDGVCGPNNGPNCPACRVLANPFLKKIWADKAHSKDGKWQGWSGVVYCGRYFGVQEVGHDGYCGPNNGSACEKCMRYMFPEA